MASNTVSRKLVRRIAKRYGLDPNVFERQINLESGRLKHVTSPAGAEGPAQLMPGTARELGVDINNPVQNLIGGARYDAQQLKAFGGNYRKALAAYNAGPGNIAAGLGYADKILQGQSPHASAGPRGGGARTKTIPGVDNSGERRALLLQYLLNQSSHDTTGNGLLQTVTQIGQLKDTPAKTVKVPGKSSATISHKGGVTLLDGKPVASWIAKRLERARAAGWQGHVNSGYRSVAEQRRIYNSGVRPAAKPGQSNHNFTAYPGGAVDVTDPQQLAAILQKLGIRKLKWAGSKDVVHFSHPHNGGY